VAAELRGGRPLFTRIELGLQNGEFPAAPIHERVAHVENHLVVLSKYAQRALVRTSRLVHQSVLPFQPLPTSKRAPWHTKACSRFNFCLPRSVLSVTSKRAPVSNSAYLKVYSLAYQSLLPGTPKLVPGVRQGNLRLKPRYFRLRGWRCHCKVISHDVMVWNSGAQSQQHSARTSEKCL